jgi:hypothetical protein
MVCAGDDDRKDITMSGKLYVAIAPLLAAVAFVALPATAQAHSHWYSEGARLPFEKEGKVTKTPVTIEGTVEPQHANWTPVTCSVSGTGNVWNTVLAKPGLAEIVTYELRCKSSTNCKEPLTFATERLPWSTELTEGTPIGVYIENIGLTVTCPGSGSDSFEGDLTPHYVNGTSTAKPSYLSFTEAGSLSGSTGALSFGGSVSVFGAKSHELITTTNP